MLSTKIYTGSVEYTPDSRFFGVHLQFQFRYNRHGNLVPYSTEETSPSDSSYRRAAEYLMRTYRMTFNRDGVILNFFGCKSLKIRCVPLTPVIPQ